MALFGRRRRRNVAAEQAEERDVRPEELEERPAATHPPDHEPGQQRDSETNGEASTAAEPAGGPRDVAEAPADEGRIDLGALQVPGRTGMKLRMEMSKSTKQVVSASLTLGGSVLQLQAFAAPRSGGLWQQLREEIAASVVKQGGSADEVDGPFGRELLARLPVRSSDGRRSHRPARFLGVDGPRWFLRGVFSGQAAISPEDAAELEDVFAGVVVDRGEEPRPPRDVLTLTVPSKGQTGDVEAETDTAGGGAGNPPAPQ